MPEFVSMKKSKEELAEQHTAMIAPAPDYPQDIYPYGLCISLCEEELEKLSLSSDVDAGDIIHLQAIGKVTSVNKRDTDQGQKVRVEIQLTDIALESGHDEAEEEIPDRLDYAKFYTKK